MPQTNFAPPPDRFQTHLPPRSPLNQLRADSHERSSKRLRSALEHTVAAVFEVDHDQLQGPTRGSPPAAMARQVAMYLAHVVYSMSMTEVGALFDRDRTTVAYACRVIEERREQAPFDQALDVLERVIVMLTQPREFA